jgi:hypothetical protein
MHAANGPQNSRHAPNGGVRVVRAQRVICTAQPPILVQPNSPDGKTRAAYEAEVRHKRHQSGERAIGSNMEFPVAGSECRKVSRLGAIGRFFPLGGSRGVVIQETLVAVVPPARLCNCVIRTGFVADMMM